MTRSFSFLVNPNAGGGAAPDAVVPVARLLREAGARVDVAYSPGPRELRQLTETAAARGDIVVGVGGDGLVSALVGPVVDTGATLGLIPAGRGNDFARMLGLPTDDEGRAKVLLEGESRTVDLIEYADGLIAGSIYAGVDARAASLARRSSKLPVSWHYPLAAFRALATFRPARYRVVVDGRACEYDAATVVVANSSYYGRGLAIAPGADLADGLLDVVIVEAGSRAALLAGLPALRKGTHTALPGVHVLRGARIELSAGDPVHVGGDGESLGVLPGLREAPAVAQVRPGLLRMLV